MLFKRRKSRIPAGLMPNTGHVQKAGWLHRRRLAGKSAAVRSATPDQQKRGDLCLWLVPTNSGKVRKIRVSWITATGLVASIALCSAFVTYVISDYARLHLSKELMHRLLSSITDQRNSLMGENKELQAQLDELSSAAATLAAYKKQVEQRVAALSTLLAAGSPFDPREILKGDGVIEQPTSVSKLAKAPATSDKSAENREGSAARGIGGLEVECGSDGCDDPRAALAPDAFTLSPEAMALIQMSNADKRTGVELLDRRLLADLDAYVSVLRTLPIGKPVRGEVNSPYGVRLSPFTKRISKHEGVDFAVPFRDKVAVTANGVVRAVKRTSTYGLMVDVMHGDLGKGGRVLTRYAHLSQALVQEGQKVRRGDIIGLVGSSGHSTGPHLHYEVRLDGRAVNPMKLIKLSKSLDGALFTAQ
jgi:murein DD-endopeptidase MepM/ murein hydrolase activator NlpD